MNLRQQLEEAEAEADRLRRQVASASCRQVGHDWKFVGGTNACCDGDPHNCECSVPVHECTKCGASDYGDNDEADEVRATCAEIRCRQRN